MYSENHIVSSYIFKQNFPLILKMINDATVSKLLKTPDGSAISLVNL